MVHCCPVEVAGMMAKIDAEAVVAERDTVNITTAVQVAESILSQPYRDVAMTTLIFHSGERIQDLTQPAEVVDSFEGSPALS
jgi:UDP-glucose 6-dehydrogenase